MKLKKGDTIKILSGKDRSKTGKVLTVDMEKSKVIVEGINVFKKHVRPKREGEKGEIVSVPRPLNASNVMIICPNCSKAAKIGYSVEGKTKTRICRKCKATIK